MTTARSNSEALNTCLALFSHIHPAHPRRHRYIHIYAVYIVLLPHMSDADKRSPGAQQL